MEVADYFIVTGGYETNSSEYVNIFSTVAKFSQSGLVEYLPSLNQGRYNHACSSYISDSGERVGFMLGICIQYQQFVIVIQVLLVTGGTAHLPGGKETKLDSTEILESSSGPWRTLTGARLPSTRDEMRAGTADNVVFLFGKSCLNVLQYSSSIISYQEDGTDSGESSTISTSSTRQRNPGSQLDE